MSNASPDEFTTAAKASPFLSSSRKPTTFGSLVRKQSIVCNGDATASFFAMSVPAEAG